MASTTTDSMSLAGYLTLDRSSQRKHEYLDGEVSEMVGASESHNLIVSNLVRELGNWLRQQDARVYPSDLRVACVSGLFTYPDVTVVAGPPEFQGEGRETLTNPRVIIEVLSPSTAAYDHGAKFAHYRSIPSLQEYVLVSQDRVAVQHFARHGNAEQWLLTMTTAADELLRFPVLGLELPLSDIYDKVTFPTPATTDVPPSPGSPSPTEDSPSTPKHP